MSDGPAPARARNRRGEGGRLRDEIVAAAVELVDEAGDESAVTLRSVARRVGVAAPSIYRHFPDQPAIMLAVVRLAFAQLHERLHAGLAAAGTAPRARLLAVCHAYLGFAQTHPERYRTMFGSGTVDDLVTLGNSSVEPFTQILGECVAAGVSASTDPPADAVALWLGLHGLAHQRAATSAFPWPADIAERLITALAHLRE